LGGNVFGERWQGSRSRNSLARCRSQRLYGLSVRGEHIVQLTRIVERNVAARISLSVCISSIDLREMNVLVHEVFLIGPKLEFGVELFA
jgi:hypothetical protein